MPNLLSDIGVTSVEESVYRAVLAAPGPLTPDDVADATELSERITRDALERLLSYGFLRSAANDPESYTGVDPGLALRLAVGGQEWRLRDHLRRLSAVRTAMPRITRELMRDMPANNTNAYDEVVGSEAIDETLSVMALSAQNEIRRLDQAPPEGGGMPGTKVRGIYPLDVVHDEATFDRLCLRRRHGEVVRLVHDAPTRLLIVDSERALVSIDTVAERERALLVEESPLLGLLLLTYDVLWDRALPFNGPDTEGLLGALAEDELALLALLAAGLKNDSIAYHLGVSPRTVSRRIAVLREALGAESRFQVGIQATRRGLL